MDRTACPIAGEKPNRSKIRKAIDAERNCFIFLLNYQNDEAQIATFRFEVLRKNQKSIIMQILMNQNSADIDDQIGLYIDSI